MNKEMIKLEKRLKEQERESFKNLLTFKFKKLNKNMSEIQNCNLKLERLSLKNKET